MGVNLAEKSERTGYVHAVYHYKNGIFSTVPRDGVFRIHNGEIAGSVSGIRISDSVTGILNNISGVSSETKNTKWWEEIQPSIMPYVMVDSVNISRSF